MKTKFRNLKLYSCLAVIIISAFVPLKAFAIDTGFYSGNDILFYNPTDTGCPSGSNITQLTGSDNRQKIYNYWISKGLTPAQSAGITGNMQAEGGFSPFRQENSQAWPNGGYGIAQFTGGQRVAVTEFLLKNLSSVFTQYYLNDYGGATLETNGFIPGGISQTVNDSFLLEELNYLSEYSSSFIPSTMPTRVSGLQSDYNITIESGVKLLDFIKTLSSASDVAKAWIYLYEQPGNIKANALVRATNAEQILTKYTGAGVPGTNSCSSVSVGGLTYDQAKNMMKYYYDNRATYFNDFWNTSGQSVQCTAFSYYFNTRFITTGTGQGNGVDVTKNLISIFPNFYKSTTKDTLQPFSIFSLSHNTAGHTGVILGIESDGSVIVGEGNIDTSSLNEANGLIEKEVTGTRSDPIKGVVAAEHWKDIDSWINAMASWGLTNPTFASPVNEGDVISKVQASL